MPPNAKGANVIRLDFVRRCRLERQPREHEPLEERYEALLNALVVVAARSWEPPVEAADPGAGALP